jgi:hypothetical protein
MNTRADAESRKIGPPHLTYSAFCLPARAGTTTLLKLKLTLAANRATSLCPVKQKRALLESNPPRDNWTEGDEIKTVSAFGEAKTSPNVSPQTFISEPSHALKNSSKTVSKSSNAFPDGQHQQKTLRKNYLSPYPFFRGKRNAVL